MEAVAAAPRHALQLSLVCVRRPSHSGAWGSHPYCTGAAGLARGRTEFPAGVLGQERLAKHTIHDIMPQAKPKRRPNHNPSPPPPGAPPASPSPPSAANAGVVVAARGGTLLGGDLGGTEEKSNSISS